MIWPLLKSFFKFIFRNKPILIAALSGRLESAVVLAPIGPVVAGSFLAILGTHHAAW